MGTTVYIDGLNLYHGVLKGTPWKWLDIEAMVRRLLPEDQIDRIHYFTAPVLATPDDPDAPSRQTVYRRALQANPLIEIHLGQFTRRVRWRSLAPGRWSDVTRPRIRPAWLIDLLQRTIERQSDRSTKVRVVLMEEKRSDVNLACRLLEDVFVDSVPKVLLISNDADFLEVVRVSVNHGVVTGVVNPSPGRPSSGHLQQAADFHLRLRHGLLADCQLPATVIDQRGRQIHRPRDW